MRFVMGRIGGETMKYLLAHDIGTSGDKAALFSADGRLIASKMVPYETFYAEGGAIEQNPQDWWQAVCRATRAVTAKIDPAQIAAVCFGGMGHCCTCLDEQGNFLAPSLLWSDSRSGQEQAELEAAFGAKRCYELTGHECSTAYTITKLMWVKKYWPEVYRKTHKVLTAKDVIVYRLTGRMCTDYSDACGYMAYDYKKMAWDPEIIRAAGLRQELFPEIVSGREVAGYVTRQAAAETGLAEGTPVVPGGMDGQVANIGAGTLGETNFHLGTSTTARLHVPADITDPEERYEFWAGIQPGTGDLAGTMNAFGGSIAWMRQNLCDREEKLAAQAGAPIFDFLAERAAESPVGARGLIFLPFLQGERTPYFDAKAKGCFLGLSMHHTDADLKRAVFEGAVLHLAMMMEDLAELSGRPAPKTASVAGGAAGSDLVCQMMADAMGCRMLRLDVGGEVGSLGAAVCGGVGVGIYPDFSAANEFLSVEREFEPNLRHTQLYREKLELYRKCYPALKEIFAKLV